MSGELSEKLKSFQACRISFNKADCDVVLDASPSDIKRLVKANKPIVNVAYELGSKDVLELKKILQKRGFI